MPPKKRGRPAASQPEPEPEPEPTVSDGNDASNQSDQDGISDSDSDADQRGRETEFKFFNTTFSTFRVSPLYIARNSLTPAGLETLSRRLRDTLVGDVVRGVQVGLEGDNATLGRLGGLERVEWRECSLAGIIPSLADDDDDDDDADRRRQKGKARATRRPRHLLLCLELEYERATFSALLLPSLDEKETYRIDENDGSLLLRDPSWTQNRANASRGRGKSKEGSEKDNTPATTTASSFAHFPLLLTRMPAALKTAVIDFLSSTFDCRISALRLGTRSLLRSWERWIGTGTGGDARQQQQQQQQALSKDVALTLGFHLEQPPSAAADEPEPQQPPVPLGLKTMDIVVPASEVTRFLRAGERRLTTTTTTSTTTTTDHNPPGENERVRRRKLGGGLEEEGWWWWCSTTTAAPNPTSDPHPFTAALATYLAHHMALDLFHPGVRVQRVLCDAFALSEGGRVKVFAPRGQKKRRRRSEAGVEVFVRDLIRHAQGGRWGGDALRLAGLEVWA
ncbi:kinetochore complex Sim4 subunit Fta1-domain-containing protein [Xylaria telfairii]|nr:kinetochore complex Sim4 subunit Fta1-domain-containing protein [Xylaria telfairii]